MVWLIFIIIERTCAVLASTIFTSSLTLIVSGIFKVIEVLGRDNVDGVYHLVKEAAEKRDDVCVDGCVYTKVGTSLRFSKRELTKFFPGSGAW